jgi:LDH2 family malate/lactate/ureidoglycolate dehydrogenase
MPSGARVDLSVPDAGAVPAWALGDGGPVSRLALFAFVAAAFRAAGARPRDAALTAETLVLADARGHPSHGVSRLRQYLRLVESGAIDVRTRPVVRTRRGALELWEGHHVLGPAVGHAAMARAVAKARRMGLAAVLVRDAGHFGIAGAYALRAMESGLVGMAMCNGTPVIAPSGARAPGLGTNPIAIGAPDGEGRGFLLDMATSVVAGGKVEVARRAGLPIPAGWALDRDGRPTTDAAAALDGMMLPLGGAAETSGYKGYGLAAAVDLLTGVLSGGAFGLAVAGMWDTGHPSTISQLHLAIDPAALGDAGAFAARLRRWRAELAGLPRQPGVDEILVAGDPEWRAAQRQAERVALLPSVAEDLARLAFERGLEARWRRVVGYALRGRSASLRANATS